MVVSINLVTLKWRIHSFLFQIKISTNHEKSYFEVFQCEAVPPTGSYWNVKKCSFWCCIFQTVPAHPWLARQLPISGSTRGRQPSSWTQWLVSVNVTIQQMSEEDSSTKVLIFVSKPSVCPAVLLFLNLLPSWVISFPLWHMNKLSELPSSEGHTFVLVNTQSWLCNSICPSVDGWRWAEDNKATACQWEGRIFWPSMCDIVHYLLLFLETALTVQDLQYIDKILVESTRSSCFFCLWCFRFSVGAVVSLSFLQNGCFD